MKITNSKNFGQALKVQRKKKGYTQKYVSDITGFSVSFISELENGKATAELEKSIYLANMLGLDILISERGAE